MLHKFVVVAAACAAASLAPAQGAAGRAPRPQSVDRSAIERQIQELRDDIRRLHAELSRLQQQEPTQVEAKDAAKDRAKATAKAKATKTKAAKKERAEEAEEQEQGEARVAKPRVWTLGGDGEGLTVVVDGEDGKPTLLKAADGKLVRTKAGQKVEKPRVWTLGGVGEGLTVVVDGDGEPKLLKAADGKLLKTKDAAKTPVQGCTCDCPCCQAHRSGAVMTVPGGKGKQAEPQTARSLFDRIKSPTRVQVDPQNQVHVIEVPRTVIAPVVPVTPKTPEVRVIAPVKTLKTRVSAPVETKVETKVEKPTRHKREISI